MSKPFYFCDTVMEMIPDHPVLPVFRTKREAMEFAKEKCVGMMHVDRRGNITRVCAPGEAK